MKKIFVLLIFFTITLTNLNFAYSISPDVFIQSTVNRASQVLSENISKEKKIIELKKIAEESSFAYYECAKVNAVVKGKKIVSIIEEIEVIE